MSGVGSAHSSVAEDVAVNVEPAVGGETKVVDEEMVVVEIPEDPLVPASVKSAAVTPVGSIANGDLEANLAAASDHEYESGSEYESEGEEGGEKKLESVMNLDSEDEADGDGKYTVKAATMQETALRTRLMFSDFVSLPSTKLHRVFLGVALLFSIWVWILASIALNHDSTSANGQYLAGTVIGGMFFFIFTALHGVLSGNRFELIEVEVFSALITIYTIGRFIWESDRHSDAGQIILMILVVISEGVFLWLGAGPFLRGRRYKGWFLTPVPTHLSAIHRSTYHNYEFFYALLRLDVFLSLSLIVLGLNFFFTAYEMILEMVAIFATFFLAYVAFIGTRLGDVKSMKIWLGLCWIQPLNVVWKSVALSLPNTDHPDIPLAQILMTAVVALVARGFLIYSCWKVGKSFKTGFIEAVFLPAEEDDRTLCCTL